MLSSWAQGARSWSLLRGTTTAPRAIIGASPNSCASQGWPQPRSGCRGIAAICLADLVPAPYGGCQPNAKHLGMRPLVAVYGYRPGLEAVGRKASCASSYSGLARMAAARRAAERALARIQYRHFLRCASSSSAYGLANLGWELNLLSKPAKLASARIA